MNEYSELSILKWFIPALIARKNALHEMQIAFEKPILSGIFEKLISIDCKQQNFIKHNAPYFNIFEVLRYGHYETRLHTPFLVFLLSLHEEHQLGELFLVQLIKFAFENKIDFDRITNLEVNEELIDPQLEGRIDIFIKFMLDKKYHYIAIENKIDADDQEKQLQRYNEYLSKLTNDNSAKRLIYLTKTGTLPAIPYSIDHDSFQEIEKHGIFKLMSYKDEINSWLSEIMDKEIPQQVHGTLQQYLQTIKNF